MIYVHQVSEVATYLKESLEADEALQDLWVQGEVSNLVRSAGGHVYFTLKDTKAALDCVVWRGSIERGVRAPENGLQITVHARVSFYEPRGRLQFQVDLVERAGLGELALQFELLKKRLAEEGLLDEQRKRPLPVAPRRIGVVTSATGAVIHDIINVVRRRYPLLEILLSPATVQGASAAGSICQAIRALETYGSCDVIILARGGGSLEELWPFNEEPVARAIYACSVPVVSGVGHETDVTIADLVADLRAPTPSAAAELVAPNLIEQREQIAVSARRLQQAITSQILAFRQHIQTREQRLHRLSPEHTLGRWRQQTDDLAGRLLMTIQNRLVVSAERLEGRRMRLMALSPTAILERGYAIVRHGVTGSLVRFTGQVSAGDPIEVRVSDGAFWGKVSSPHNQREGA